MTQPPFIGFCCESQHFSGGRVGETRNSLVRVDGRRDGARHRRRYGKFRRLRIPAHRTCLSAPREIQSRPPGEEGEISRSRHRRHHGAHADGRRVERGSGRREGGRDAARQRRQGRARHRRQQARRHPLFDARKIRRARRPSAAGRTASPRSPRLRRSRRRRASISFSKSSTGSRRTYSTQPRRASISSGPPAPIM